MDPMQIIAGAGTGIIIFYLVLMVFMTIVWWKIFTKAGQPGWAVLVPIYSAIIYFKVLRKPGWWVAVYFGMIVGLMIPFVNFVAAIGFLVFSIIWSIDLAKAFGKSPGFGVGIWFFGIVFLPMLAFGKDVEHLDMIEGAEGAAEFGTPEVNPNTEAEEV